MKKDDNTTKQNKKVIGWKEIPFPSIKHHHQTTSSNTIIKQHHQTPSSNTTIKHHHQTTSSNTSMSPCPTPLLSLSLL